MLKTFRAAVCSIALAGALAAAPAPAQRWQCAPFARLFSGIQLFGAAAGWWAQAVGRYTEGTAPRIGSVLVFKALDSMRSGHVATVTQVVGDRIIKVTHANWGGAKGRVEHDVTIVDASAANDWSAVKVWYAPIRDLGLRAYPAYGFIYGDAAKPAARADAAAASIASAGMPAPATPAS